MRGKRAASVEKWLTSGITIARSALDEALDTPVLPPRKVAGTDIVAILHATSHAVATGVPAEVAFSAQAAGYGPTPPGALCETVAASIARGATLPDALSLTSSLPPAALSMLRLAAQTGDAAGGLERAATLIADDITAARLLRRAIRIPALAVGALAVVLAVVVYVIRPVLSAGGAGPLPGWASGFLAVAAAAPLVLVPLALATWATRFLLRLPLSAPTVRRQLDALVLRVPGLGKSAAARFRWRAAAAIAMALRAGRGLPAALRAGGGACGNAVCESACVRAARQIEAGVRPAAVLDPRGPLGGAFAAAIAAGESSGTTPAALDAFAAVEHAAADDLARRAAARITAGAVTFAVLAVLAGASVIVTAFLAAAP